MDAIEVKESNGLAFFFSVMANFSEINFGDSNFHSLFLLEVYQILMFQSHTNEVTLVSLPFIHLFINFH